MIDELIIKRKKELTELENRIKKKEELDKLERKIKFTKRSHSPFRLVFKTLGMLKEDYEWYVSIKENEDVVKL